VRTALKIKKLAEESGIPRISFVGNLVADDDDRAFLTEALGEPPLACFPDSAAIRKTERAGLPITGALGEVEEAAGELISSILGQVQQ
jgi:CO dehydrogenase nickel-insertion accessory protein CooC1